MAEIDRSQLGPDELFLSGRLQVDTAIAVLAMTSVNPGAETELKAIRDIYDAGTEPGAQNGLSVYLQGEAVAAMRVDIVESALLAEQNQTFPEEQRIAAGGLASILSVTK